MLPQLRRLEEKYRREMVVVGVSAGKFRAERETPNVRQAVLRLDLDHPVVNDRYFRIWRSYAVSAWPTLVLVDPEGYVIGAQPGEITFEMFDPVIARLVTDCDSRGVLDRNPLPLERPERLTEPRHDLAFPGKVLATADGRLLIADSDHHRVLAVDLAPDGLSGQIREVIGSGDARLADGDYATASFNRPQGLSLHGDILYVADSENHAIRAVDLTTRQVTTVAGTGEQARRHGLSGPATRTPLSSPWDVESSGGDLYVAMAGTHQVYRLNHVLGEVHPYAGSGREDIADGSLRGSALAQPMGITTDGQRLYFADTESSGVRFAELPPGDRVESLVGTGLFDFGDVDGKGEAALLQHDQGIVWSDGRLYVADTYNNKVKVVDPATREVQTLLGTGSPGHQDGDQPQFWEPSGLSVANGRLYVADTNNHAIRVADLPTGRVETLKLAF